MNKKFIFLFAVMSLVVVSANFASASDPYMLWEDNTGNLFVNATDMGDWLDFSLTGNLTVSGVISGDGSGLTNLPTSDCSDKGACANITYLDYANDGNLGIGITPTNILDIYDETNGTITAKLANNNSGSGAVSGFVAEVGITDSIEATAYLISANDEYTIIPQLAGGGGILTGSETDKMSLTMQDTNGLFGVYNGFGLDEWLITANSTTYQVNTTEEYHHGESVHYDNVMAVDSAFQITDGANLVEVEQDTTAIVFIAGV